MTEDRLPLNELLQKAGDGDFLRAVAESVLQLLMEADVEGLIGAGRHERAADRLNWRNGYRDRTLDTRLGSLNLKIPKLRAGSYFPPFLEARKTTEKALVAVIQEAWIGGVSTRRVDEIAQAMGLSGISKSQVSKLCKEIDERVKAFLERPLEGDWPYLWYPPTGALDWPLEAARGRYAAPRIWSRPRRLVSARGSSARASYLPSLDCECRRGWLPIAPDRVDEEFPGPEVLPHEIAFALSINPGHVDRALALDETHHLRHRVSSAGSIAACARDRASDALLRPSFLLKRKPAEHFAQMPAHS